jgi:hypothetical protein
LAHQQIKDKNTLLQTVVKLSDPLYTISTKDEDENTGRFIVILCLKNDLTCYELNIFLTSLVCFYLFQVMAITKANRPLGKYKIQTEFRVK